jgi:hypothetical protein
MRTWVSVLLLPLPLWQRCSLHAHMGEWQGRKLQPWMFWVAPCAYGCAVPVIHQARHSTGCSMRVWVCRSFANPATVAEFGCSMRAGGVVWKSGEQLFAHLRSSRARVGCGGIRVYHHKITPCARVWGGALSLETAQSAVVFSRQVVMPSLKLAK